VTCCSWPCRTSCRCRPLQAWSSCCCSRDSLRVWMMLAALAAGPRGLQRGEGAAVPERDAPDELPGQLMMALSVARGALKASTAAGAEPAMGFTTDADLPSCSWR